MLNRPPLSRELSYVADEPIFLIENHRDRLIRDDQRELLLFK